MKHIARTICLGIFTLVLTNIAVVGQIKIPKIFRPKPEQPVQTQPPTQPVPPISNSVNGTRESIGTSGSYVDDGFTWFEAVPTKDPEIKQTNVYTGWVLKSSIRLMGIFPAHSAFKIVVSRGGSPVSTNRCEASSYNTPAKNPADVSFIYTDGCWKNEMPTKEVGKFDVDIIAISGGTNAETSVRKYKIEVLKIDRVNAQTGKLSAPDSPRYVISRHAEAPVSILFLRPSLAYGYVLSGVAGKTANINQVEILFSLSPSDAAKPIPHGTMRCSVDGKRLEFPGGGLQADLAVSHEQRQYQEIYSDRIAAAYLNGPSYHDELGFRLVLVTLPLTYGTKGDGSRLSLSNYPGNWECSLMNNGEKWRTWRWTVGRDGMPVKHPEQNGSVNLYMNSYLIDTEIPAGGSALDQRLVPTSAAQGFFYGQKWTTPEGKAMAAKVPTKGSPVPVPSNKIK